MTAIRADDVARQRGYCDHFVMIYVRYVDGWVRGCEGVFVSMAEMKTPDWDNLKLGTVIVLDTMSKPIDFEFKRFR